MEVPVTRKLDLIDADRLSDMMKSDPFRLFTARVQAELDRQRSACEGASLGVEIYRAQGATKALRTVLELPKQILQEITSASRS